MDCGDLVAQFYVFDSHLDLHSRDGTKEHQVQVECMGLPVAPKSRAKVLFYSRQNLGHQKTAMSGCISFSTSNVSFIPNCPLTVAITMIQRHSSIISICTTRLCFNCCFQRKSFRIGAIHHGS